jgi:hypothetical protein
MKKLFYAANIIIAIVAGADCFVWGMGLSSSTILWHNGLVCGYIFLTLLTIVVVGFCMLPSLMISEW